MKPWLIVMFPLLIFHCASGFCEQPMSEVLANDRAQNWDHTRDHTWVNYKQQFIQPDGRLIDYHQNSTSHSEGQGYGLMLALHFDDKAVFEKIWLWTKNNLQRNKDKLFSWSWGKNSNNCFVILDSNNATDGDILIAYALLLAAKRWSLPELKIHAIEITNSILGKLTIKLNQRIFLLPGELGFNFEKTVKLNPSYQILSAYSLFATETNDPLWLQIKQDAEYLIQQSFDRKSGLPADWVWLDKESSQVIKKSSQYGYEAIRVYLYQLWQLDEYSLYIPEVMFSRFKRDAEIFSLYDFAFPEKKYPYTALSGIYQIYAEVAERSGDKFLATAFRQKASQKYLQEQMQYYGHTLYLLSQVRP